MKSTKYMERLIAEKGDTFAAVVNQIAMFVAVTHKIMGELPDESTESVMDQLSECLALNATLLTSLSGADDAEVRHAVDAYIQLAREDSASVMRQWEEVWTQIKH